MHRLGIFYFLIFFSVGVYAPWMPPFLKHHGLSASAIGLALAAVALARATLTPLWGIYADRAASKRRILSLTALLAGTTLVSLAVPWPASLFVVILFVYGVFLVPVVPLAEVLTLDALGGERPRYGRIRLWGSLGFIVSSVGLGAAVKRLGIELVPFAAGLPLVLAGLVATRAPESRGVREQRHLSRDLRNLPWRPLIPVLLAATLGQASHGPYYAYFTLQMSEQGVAAILIGALWAWGVIVEIAVMAASTRLLPRIGLYTALRWALILTTLRWVLFAAEPSLWLVAIGQTLHAASFGMLHLTSVQLVDDLMPPGSKALGQTVLSATAYGWGIGGALALAGVSFNLLWYPGLYGSAALLAALGWAAAGLASRRARGLA